MQKIGKLLLPVLMLVAHTSFAQVGIQSLSSTYTAASTGKSYSTSGASNSPLDNNDYTYKYGTNSGTSTNILNFSSFTIGTSATYAYRNITNAYVKMRRHDNDVATGERQILWYEATSTDISDGATLNMRQPYQESMDIMFNGARGLNAGTDNIFNNSADGNGNNNNIERFDYIIPDGYTITTASQEGFIVMDRGVLGAHDPFTVSVVKSLSGSQNPATYSNVLWINSSNYGSVNPISVMTSNVLRKDESDSKLRISTSTDASQGIGGVFIRFSDLGLTNGTTIYGYSVFGGDFPSGSASSKVVDWMNETYFPTTTTPSAGGLDMLAVSGVFQLSNALAPLANDVTRAALCNPNGTGQVSVPSLSATDLNSGGVISSYKIVTLPSVSQGVLYYYNGSSYVAATAGMTLTTSQSTSLKFDPADGFMGEAEFQYTATNSFGLVSNVAYVNIPVYTMPTTTAGPNVSICSGGSVELDAEGATTYTWSPATNLSCTTCANPIATPTVTRTYTLTGAHPASGCTSSATITVSVNGTPPTISGTAYVCPGQTTTLTGSPTGGTWTSSNTAKATVGSASGVVTGVANGTATITYTTVGGACKSTKVVTVDVLDPIANDVTSTPICNTSGQFAISPLSGYDPSGCSPLSYFMVMTIPSVSQGVLYYHNGSSYVAITSGSTLLTLSQAATLKFDPATGFSGNCTFQYISKNGYYTHSAYATYTIPVGLPPTVSGGSNVTICRGASTTLTASGATTYTWSPATNLSCTTCASTVASPTATTTYTVTGTNAGCSNTASVTVSVNSLPAVSAGSNVTICAGASTSLSGSGASTYVWTPATALSCTACANPSASPTTTTTYTVTGTASTGCQATASVVVSVNPTAGTITGSANVCIGTTTTLTGTPAGGTWASNNGNVSVGLTTGIATGVTAGTSMITYRLATGCYNTKEVTVNPAVSASATGVNPNCFASNNGTVDLTVSGGTPTFTYAWSNGATTQDLSGVSAGTYSVTITDSKGCSTTASKTLTAPAALSLSATFTNVSCNGGTNGTIDLSVSGGTSPYTYLWSNGATTQDVTSLAAGTYSVTVTDNKGCTATTSKTITQPATALSASETSVHVSCYANSDGSIDLSVTGGTSPYTYNWGGGVTSQDRSGLVAGTYSVTVTDNKGCTTSLTKTINQPAALSATGTTTDVSCFASNNGSINVTVAGGTTPYTYNWGGGITTEDRSGLAAGTYSVTVTDNNGCATTLSKTISQPTALAASATTTNVSCNGGNNGTVDATVTGGTTPYTYAWSNGATTQDLSGLAAGTYSVTVTDNKGCTTTLSKTITQPATLAASATTTNVSCNGGNNGTIDLTVTGGTTAYSYLWSTGATTQDLSGLSGGTYSVVVTDNKGCTATVSKTITQPTAITATTASTNALCNACSNGTASVTPNGGTPGYTYVWSTGATTQSVTGLVAGTYTVTVKDANNCAVVKTVTITQPETFTASTTNTNVSCNGGNNATADLTVSGGTTPYTYAWSNGATTQDLSGLTAGTYSVVVTDANSYTVSATVTVTQPAVLTATGTTTNVSCNGGNNGAVDMTVTGGTTPYTYLWSTGATTQDLSGLAAGTYSVTVTDNKGCTTTLTKTITEPATLAASATTTNVSCNGGNNGTIDATVTGGTTPYTYLWSTGATTQDLSGLAAGTYSVTVTDNKGCTTTLSKTITQPATLAASATTTNVSCNGGNNGTIDLTVTGGTTAYTYLWSTGATTQDLSGLSAGTYSVVVTDSKGCTATVSKTITQPTAITATTASTNALCNGCANGTASVTPNGGTPGYTYVWSTGATTQSVTGLAAGTYTVTVKDANNCAVVKTVTITQPETFTASTTNTNVSCNGGNNATADLTVSGGTTPYTYAWSNGATTQDLSGLTAGTYSVVVTDANSYTVSATVTITQPAVLAATGTTTNVSCNGGNNGTVDMTVSGGTTPYIYVWSNGATTQDLSGLAAGTYSVTVTDNKGCTTTLTKTITEPATLAASATTTNVSCNGGNNGTVDMTVSGGTTPYTYVWSNGATTQDLSGLAAGTYSVTVTDNKGCITTLSKTITQPAVLAASATTTNVSCNGGTNGTIDLTVTGGTTAYTYLWSTGATTQDLSGLSAGTYSVVVADSKGCTATVSKAITQPTAVTATTASTNALCNGCANGTASVTPNGGTSGYTYVWSTGATTQSVTGLAAGTYTVTVKDANNCAVVKTVTITQPEAFTASVTNTNVNCNGGANGTSDLTVSGGTTPYIYAWSNGATTQDLSGLTAGTYSVVVTDANSYTVSAIVTITQPAVLAASATTTNVSCNDGNNGTVDMTVTGGTTPYTYVWSNGATTQDLSGLAAGTYSVTVTDNKGCITTLSKTITQPAVLAASATTTNVSCNGGANGTIDLTVTGGTTAYTYLWSTGATTQDLSGLSAGTYSVVVTDSKGCTATVSKAITQPTAVTATTASTNALCNGCANGTASVTPNGGTPGYTYLWSTGATTSSVTGLTVGTYTVTVKDVNNCTVVKTITITQPDAFTASTTNTNVSCNGGNNATSDLTVSGGTTPYTYAWSNGATTQDLSGLTAGTYSVVVTDANSYTVSATVTITQPAVLAASATTTNVSCNGGNNGTVDMTVTGGTTPYTYVWSNGSTTQDLSGLAAGTYSVTVTDNKGCTTTLTKTITEPATLAASATTTSVSCNGGNNGTIDATVSGGTTPYTYAWSNGATTQDLSGLAAGTYSVTVTDNKGCTTTLSKTITQPATLSASATTTNVSCNGGNNGTIDLTVTGGTTAYTYLWSNGATTQDLSGLSAGTYSVVVTDNKGCTATVSKTITQPTAVTATTASTNALCNGCANGTASVTPNGGTPGYTYLWSTAATTSSVTGLIAGTYTVTVKDVNNCSIVKTVTITQPDAFTASVTNTNVNCNGGVNGTADLTVSGGTTPYTYAWSNGATTQDLSGLAAGTYSVVVTDANGYTITQSVTVTQPATLTATATSENVRCYGESNGSVDVTVAGGTTAYTYVWSNGATTQDITGLAAGTYSAVVTDANGCTATITKTITQPAVLSATATSTNALCNGCNNGTASVTATGGTTAYTYLWSNGATTQNVTGLVAGTYTVTVTDANGCTTTTTVTITQPEVFTASVTNTNVNCNGGANGTADLTVSGGTTPYTYAWSNGATTQDLSGLTAGTYSVVVTDANGYAITQSVTVTQPATLSATATSENVSCYGESNGSVDVTVTGGTTAYAYSWSNGATTQDITGLAAGTYSVLVTDANGCTATITRTITQPAVLAASATSTNALCNGCNNGTANVTATGGTTAYTYLWSNGATTQNVTGLVAGTYTVTVTDANGCTTTTTVTITQPEVFTASVTNTNVNCNGGANGTADLTVSGGTTPYTYAWSNGATTQDLSGLTAGTYSVVVTDANGYTITQSVTVTQPATLSATATSENVRCYGESNGSVDVTVTGGTTAYTYNWSNGATTQDITGHAAGTYSVLVTDANGCTATITRTITQPAVLAASATSTNALCNGCNNGTASVTATGGTTAYTYLWSNGATTQNVTGLVAGTYTVTVTDANGCVTTTTVTITQPEAFTASVTNTNVNCNGGANGTADLTVSGGTTPYTYAWSNGATTQDLSGLTAGTYSVVVTDANGYTITQSVTVTQPATLTATATSENVRCYGESNGSVDVTVTGGTTAYTYVWSNGATTQYITGLAAGTYSVLVTDANGCTATITRTITQPAVLSASATSTNALCNGCNNGTASVTATGGTTAYTYLWSNGATTQNVTGLVAGTYTVTVTDANGCVTTTTVTITQPEAFTASVTNTNVNCNGGSNGTADLTVSGGTTPYTYAWSNGATTQDLSGLAAGTYSVVVTDAHGYTATATVTISQPAAVSVTGSATNVTCNGASNGSIDLAVTGGTAPYTYSWSNGATAEDITTLGVGTYSVTVTDANGCTATTAQSITQPASLTESCIANQVGCYGGATGYLNITIAGGTAPYTYVWSNGATTQDIFGLTAGTYSVVITDANGCSLTKSYTLTQPAAPVTVTQVVNNVTCNGFANGSVDLTVTGGTAPYTYTWSTGATTQDMTGMAPGTYSVTVKDAHLCSVVRTFTITQPADITVLENKTHVSCFGGNNGSINITIGGGTAPFTYVWSNGATTEDVAGLVAGTHSVTITDANGCVRNRAYAINQPSNLVVTGTTAHATCNGGTGSVDVTVSGGTAPYTYNWSNGATTQDIVATAGTYSVSVTDANGCTNTQVFTITEPVPMVVAGTTNTVICGCLHGMGEIYTTVAGGTAPYTYLWSDGSTNQNDTGLWTGTYSVVVTDLNGCTATGAWSVISPVSMSVFSSITNVGCHGANNGSIELAVTGGIAPYTYSWSNGASTSSVSDLAGGTYSVTITDANGCARPEVFVVSEPSALTVSGVTTNASCYGNEGNVNLTVSGGAAPYTFGWSNGAVSEDITATAGTYNLSVTDANGCIYTQVFTITQPEPMVVAGTTNTVVCGCLHGMGEIYTTVLGGTAPYTYLWSNGSTNQNDTGLWTGTYSVIVTDLNGCTSTGSWSVISPVSMSVFSSVANVNCHGANNGSIELAVTGGIAPYTYSWSTGATSSSIGGLAAGLYSVTITDANGCARPEVFTVTEPATIAISGSATNVYCTSGIGGGINITVNGGTAPYVYSWSNGATSEDLSGLTAGSYSVIVTDANGCTANQVYTIINSGVPSVLVAGPSNICGGSMTYMYVGIPAGGVWSSSNASIATVNAMGMVSTHSAGSVILTYTITNICGTYTATKTVNVNAGSVPAITGPSTAACGGATIALSNTATGGVWSSSNTVVATVGSTGIVTSVANGTAVISYTISNSCGTSSATRVVTVDGAASAGVISGPNHMCVGGIVPLASTVPGGVWSNGNPLVAITCPCNSGQVTGISQGTATLSYTVTNACGTAYATYVVSVHAVPTVTPGLIAPVIAGYGNASMPFTATGAPSTYSITWNSLATTAGFANVTAAAITTSPLTIAVPGAVSEATYTGSITVNNGYCTSVPQTINVTVNQSVLIYTYAGTGVNGYTGNDNAAVLAKMSHPYGVATDCNGNAYITDFENAVVRKVSSTGVITTIGGNGVIGYSGDGGPATAAKMSHAHGVAIDAAGNVYFSDYNNHAVRKISTSGIITRVAGAGGVGYTGDGGSATLAKLSYPSGLTIDGAGNLYIADNGNSVVRKVTPAGIITTFAGNGIPGYAGDNAAATAAKLFAPTAVHADATGNLYVADWGNQVVRKVDASGTITTIAGNGTAGYSGDGGPATAAKLNRPNGVTTDNSGNVYFSEQLNAVVRKVNASGVISTIAGTTATGYSGDGGPALLAKLNQPMGLSRDCAGHIYIADNGNYAVRILGAYNRAPFFKKGASQNVDVCTGSAAIIVDTNLAATDFDTAQTETWTVVSAPAHGTLVAATTAVSTGSLITPSGLSYTPATGYTGSDVFVVKVSDGTAHAITTVNVTVSVPPVAGVISGTTAICGTGTTLLSTTGTGGSWSSSNTAVATVNALGTVVGTGYGTATISYTVTNACGTSVATKVVTYNPMPSGGTVIGAAKVCKNSSLTFTNAIPGGIWSSGNTSIATVDASGLVYGVDTGIATISYAVTNACGTAYGMRNITVEILPVVGPISGPSGVCVGSEVTFANATPFGAWYSSNTAVATVDILTGAVTGVAVGTAVISYVHNTSCGVVNTLKTINVNPASVTVPAIGGPSVVCPAATIALTNGMAGGTWSSSNITKLTVGSISGIVTGVAAGTANVTYTVSHACGTSYIVKEVTINPMPTVTPITGTMSICIGWTITASNATPGGVWSSSNSSLATVNTAGAITGVAGGMPVISYSVSNMCGTVHATALVPVGTPPAVAAISGASTTCVAADIAFTNSTLGGTWTSSNTAIASVNSAGIVTGVGAGTTTITYSVHNGCGFSTATKVVSVNPLPVVSTITGPASVCIGSDITLANTISGGVWTSSNTSVATVGSTGIVSGVGAGTSTISYSVTNGCGTAVATKVVNVQVMFASIYTSHVSTVGGNDGCALLTVTGGIAPYTFLWSNGATTQNLSGLYAGTYSVIVTDANGDTATATCQVTGLVARGSGSITEGNVAVMHGAHPNPFVSTSIIRFNLPEGKFATVDIFSAATGAKVATIFSDHINAGEEYTATIDGNNIAAGVYIYRISTEITSYLGKVVLVK